MNRHHSDKILILLLLPVSLVLVIAGVAGLIKNLSPNEIDNLLNLTRSFYEYFEYHVLIFIGALFLVKVLMFIINSISLK